MTIRYGESIPVQNSVTEEELKRLLLSNSMHSKGAQERFVASLGNRTLGDFTRMTEKDVYALLRFTRSVDTLKAILALHGLQLKS